VQRRQDRAARFSKPLVERNDLSLLLSPSRGLNANEQRQAAVKCDVGF
jgi:hypothetical protein